MSTAADLAVTNSGPASITAGNNISYTITVINNGPSDAQSVTLSDALAAGATFVSEAQSSGPSFTCTPGAASCNIATLASTATATFTLILKVAASVANGTVLTNTTSVASPTDSMPGNNSQSTSAIVSASADLAVTKSGPAAVAAGNNMTYSVTVTNNGPSDAQSVSLTDATPSNTTFVSQTQSAGPTFTCAKPPAGGTGNVVCTLTTLAVGASASFSVVDAILLRPLPFHEVQ